MSGADTSPGIARAVSALAVRADRAMAKRDARYAKAAEWLKRRDDFDDVVLKNSRRDPHLAERARLLAAHAAWMGFVWTALAEHRHSDAKQAALHAYRMGKTL